MSSDRQNLSDPIFEVAAASPERPAVIEHERALSFRDFAVLIGKASAYLRGIGVGPGDRIGIALTNSGDHLILFYALARLGAAPVEIAPGTTSAQREALAEKFGIRLLFEEPDARSEPSLRTVWLDTGWRAMIAERSGDFRYDGPEEPYLVGLSSGTTGTPKGVATTHRQLLARCASVREPLAPTGAYAPEKPGHALMLASLSFTAFRNHAIFATLSGWPLVLVPELHFPSDLIRTVRSWDDALVMATAGMCRAFKEFARGKGLLFPNARALLSAGLPLFAHEKRAVIERVTPNFFEAYGSTASGRISVLRPEEIEAHAESVGRICDGMEVEIVDGQDRPLPAGSIGRLRCRGATVSTSFLVASDETRDEGFREGWHYPGDLASIDRSGYLRLHGRSSDLIVGKGVEFLPNEVEAVLTAHASVLEAAVVGAPVGGGSEEAVAMVVTRGPSEHAAIAAHLARHLPPDKRPQQILYADTLPRTPNGKIDRAAVRRLAERHLNSVR